MPKWTKKELEDKISDVKDDLRMKRNYLNVAEKEVERLQIVLERYQEELKKITLNPSSRHMQ